MRVHQGRSVYPKIYDTLSREYCIIFGAALQAEHKFALAVIFVLSKERKMIMWVEKVKTGYKFVERFTDPLTGRYRRVSVIMEKDTAQSRKTAQKALNAKIDRAMMPQEKKITLSQLVEYYGEEQIKTVKLQTYSRNQSACNALIKLLGADTLVNRLTAGYVRERLIASGRENGTLNEWLTRFKGLIKCGYRNDYVSDISYLEKLERFKDIPHREKIQDKFLEADELKALLDEMTVTKWKLLTEFLALSGLRFGEAAALYRSDVDLKERVIHVTKTYNQAHDIVTTPKTGTSVRDVYIQDELLSVCKMILVSFAGSKVVPISRMLFPGTRREHMQFDCYAKYLREKSEKVLGRRITPHTLRHTHASLLMEQGVDIDSISRRLGHTDSRITRDIYLHVTKKLEDQQNERLKEVKIL